MNAGRLPDEEPNGALAPVVEKLCQAATTELTACPQGTYRLVLPSRDIVIRVVEAIRAIFFPGYFGTSDLRDESLHYYIGATLDRLLHELEEQVCRGLAFASRHDYESCKCCCERAQAVTQAFLSRLPAVRDRVATDVEGAYEGDPALRSRDEAIFSYPGLFAVTNQRLAHELHLLGVPLIPRMITEHAHTLTGIDIHPGARIGEKFFIDHGTGVVIGETSVIGNRVRIYQGVTLGSTHVDAQEVARHATSSSGVSLFPFRKRFTSASRASCSG